MEEPDDNPFQTPQVDRFESTSRSSDFWVDGKYLVLRSGTALPHFCIKTNEPVQEDDIKKRNLTWCPPLIGLLILLSGLVMIIVYFIVRKNCTVIYGLSPEIRQSYRTWTIIKVLLVIGLFFAIPLSMAIDDVAAPLIVMLLFFVAVISLFIGNSPISIAKHRDGEFWISGCSNEFLNGIEASE